MPWVRQPSHDWDGHASRSRRRSERLRSKPFRGASSSAHPRRQAGPCWARSLPSERKATAGRSQREGLRPATPNRPWRSMETERRYLFVTPHGRRLGDERGWSTRPAQLARALAAEAEVSILARTHPLATLAAARRLKPFLLWPWPVFATRTRLPGDPQLLEHSFPPGRLESRRHVRRRESRTRPLPGFRAA